MSVKVSTTRLNPRQQARRRANSDNLLDDSGGAGSLQEAKRRVFQAENLISLNTPVAEGCTDSQKPRPLSVSVLLWKLQHLFFPCSFIKSFDEWWPISLQLLQQVVLFSLPHQDNRLPFC